MVKAGREMNSESAAPSCFEMHLMQTGSPYINFPKKKNFFDNEFLLCVRKGTMIHKKQVQGTLVAIITLPNIIMDTG